MVTGRSGAQTSARRSTSATLQRASRAGGTASTHTVTARFGTASPPSVTVSAGRGVSKGHNNGHAPERSTNTATRGGASPGHPHASHLARPGRRSRVPHWLHSPRYTRVRRLARPGPRGHVARLADCHCHDARGGPHGVLQVCCRAVLQVCWIFQKSISPPGQYGSTRRYAKALQRLNQSFLFSVDAFQRYLQVPRSPKVE